MTRSLAVPLMTISLALSACGGSSATPRTTDGVKQDLTAFAELLAAGKSKQACDQYVSPVLAAEMKLLGGCVKLLDYELAQKPINVGHATAGFSATVQGNSATYRTNTGGGKATYVKDHWVFENSGTSGGSATASSRVSADAAAKELAHSAQVAVETYATDNAGSYRGVTAAILNQYEATIQVGPGNGNAYIAADGVTATASTYTVAATASNGTDTFSITRNKGTIARTCQPVGQGGCAANGTW